MRLNGSSKGKPGRAPSGGSPPREKHARALCGVRAVGASRSLLVSPSSWVRPWRPVPGGPPTRHNKRSQGVRVARPARAGSGEPERHVRRHHPGLPATSRPPRSRPRSATRAIRSGPRCRPAQAFPLPQRRRGAADRPPDHAARPPLRHRRDHQRRSGPPVGLLEQSALALRRPASTASGTRPPRRTPRRSPSWTPASRPAAATSAAASSRR